MRNRSQLLMIACGLILPCVSATPLFSHAVDVGQLTSRLDSAFHRAFNAGFSPGFAIGVVSADSVLYANGFGLADVDERWPVTPNTQFYIASSSKSLTALAVLSLNKKGVIALDAPISRYLTKVRFEKGGSADSITIRDLLAMTHGISNVGPVTFRLAFSGEFEPTQLESLLSRHTSGKRGEFKYGNIGYNVLGMIIEAVTGQHWKAVVQREVLDPLGMTRTQANLSEGDRRMLALPYQLSDSGFQSLYYAKADANMHSAGGHVSSVTDMARFLMAQLNEGRVERKQAIDPDLIRMSHVSLTEQSREFWNHRRIAWSAGWDISDYDGDTVYSRSGSFSGFFSYVGFMPEYGIGVVGFANEESLGGELINLATSYTYDLLRQRSDADSLFTVRLARSSELIQTARAESIADGQKRAARAAMPLLHPLSAFTGKYVNDDLGTMNWTMEDSLLFVSMGVARSRAETYDAATNALRVELIGGGSVVKFTFDGDRAVSLQFMGFNFRRSE